MAAEFCTSPEPCLHPWRSMSTEEVNDTVSCVPCAERRLPPEVYLFLYMSTAAVVLLTACGNLLVIVSVCHFKQLHTPTNLLILSLAVADFLMGILVMPFQMSFTIEPCWMFGFVLCEIYKLCSMQLTVVSIFNVTLIAVDRYISLYIPFHYSNVVTLRVILTTVLCTWTFSSLYSVCLLYFNRFCQSTQACPGECFFIMNQTLYICDLLFIFILPSATIITLYMKIFIMARKHVVAIRAVIQPTNHQSKAPRSEHKAAKALSMVVGVFMAALLPYYISSMLTDFIDEQAFTIMVNCFSILFCFNSTINPVIYALFHPWFQKSVKLILTRQIFNPDSSLKNVIS
uniref:G-protein coupled receptors family 1 profile domain-containing protein n=1 Tax=Denticeps clupeoides TaxID=299321 RepID=A0AAY4B1B0_9TELE